MGAAAVFAASPASAAPSDVRVDAGSLAGALNRLAAQAGIDLIFDPRDIGDRRTSGVRGRMSLKAALDSLLAGSGLTFRRTPDGSYVVYRVPEAPVAQQAIPDIVVTGRRTQDADIRRTRNDIQPYRVAGAREIAEARRDTVDDFLRSRLPSNATVATAAQMSASDYGSTRSQVDLHGLGANQTLVLVDGLRLPTLPGLSTNRIQFLQSDLNGLPLGRIDRIETLTATAGGIYGPGATGGVVNVVLRRDYRGADVTLDTSLAPAGGGARRRVEARFGFTPDGGATDVMVAASHQVVDGLTAGERTLNQRAAALAYANDPAVYLQRVPVSNGIIVSGKNLSLIPSYGGAALGSDLTWLSLGSTGDPGTQAVEFAAHAGSVPPSISPDAAGTEHTLLSGTVSTSVLATVRHRFAPDLEAFVDLLELEDDGRATVPSVVVQTVTLQAGAAGNPFRQTVQLIFPLPGFGLTVTNRIRTTRLTGGLIVGLPGDWKVDASVGIGSVRNDITQTGSGTGDPAYVFLNFGLPLPQGSPVLNPFGDWQAFLSAIQSFRDPQTFHARLYNRFADANLRLSGPVARLPGGDLTATLSLERRREADPGAAATSLAYGEANAVIVPSLLQLTQSAYGELRAPLVPFAVSGPWRGLELQAALRFDRSRADGPAYFDAEDGNGPQTRARWDTLSFTAGLRLFPLRPLMLRASVSTGSLPPTPTQVGSQRQQALISDPRRGDSFYDVNILSLGSLRLRPEQATTVTVGLVLNPNAPRRPRLSVDWIRTTKRREIADLYANILALLTDEAAFPDRVIRAPLSDADRSAGYAAGRVTTIDATYANTGQSSVTAVDIDADWTVPLAHGALRLAAAATWEPDLTHQIGPGLPRTQAVGYDGGPLEWRANGGAEWTRGRWSVGVNGQYYSTYRIDTQGGFPTYFYTVQGSSKIPAQFYLDLGASYRLPLGGRAGSVREAVLRVGITNVLGHLPPVVANDLANGYSFYGDPRLRRLSVTFTSRL